MSIYRKVQAVEKVFHQLEKDVATFQQATSLRCKSQCGACCMKPDIAATVLEFLPLAYALAKNNQAHQWLEKIKNHNNSICVSLSPFLKNKEGGFCSNYNYRGMICRTFGFSAMRTKDGLKLVTCKTIKTEFSTAYESAVQHIKERKAVPLISNYYSQLRSIDPNLGTELIPINQAIQKSIETVLSYYAYRRMKRVS